MKRTLPVSLSLCVLLATPALAGRIASTKITHLEQIYQVYAGSSEGNNPCFFGYEVSPAFPNPTGPGTGIANTTENPACCKLLIDVEYILQTAGIGQPKK